MSESYEAYLAWVTREIGQLPSETCDVARANGRTLAADAVALIDLPRWDASAMDGFAIRWADLASHDPAVSTADSATPSDVRVVGEVAAGASADPPLGPGEAVRIMTGAPLPSDADTVIPIEEVVAPGETEADTGTRHWDLREIRLLGAPRVGSHVRQRGEDIRAGETVLPAGARLGAAALAATGHWGVEVTKVARVAVLSTGSELLTSEASDAGVESLRRGQIPESNSLLIAGLVQDLGESFALGEVTSAADEPETIRQRIAELAATHDVVITTGGIGPGRYDVVRLALQEEPNVRQTELDLKPGRHQAAGRHRSGAFLFALPGNPVAAAVSFELVVRPALLTLVGRSQTERTRLAAVSVERLPGKPGRLRAQPVRLFQENDVHGSWVSRLQCAPVVPMRRVSHSMASYGSAQGLALIESHRGDVEAGETVWVVETVGA